MLGKYGFRTADVAESTVIIEQAYRKIREIVKSAAESRELVEQACGKVWKLSNRRAEGPVRRPESEWSGEPKTAGSDRFQIEAVFN